MEDIFQIIRTKDDHYILSNIDRHDVNTLNEYQQNLLHEAISNGKYETAAYLIAHDINLDSQDLKGMTPLHYAVLFKNISIAESMIKKGATVNVKDNFGNNPLWTAVFNARGEYDFVKLLLQYGADAHNKNNSGRSPLDFAVQINDKELQALLT